MKKSYLHPAVVLTESKYGRGLFARSPIQKGEVIIDWTEGPGVIMPTVETYEEESRGNHFTLQVDENRHLVSIHVIEPCDYINHSCDPNCGIVGSMQICAIKDIAAGEEICYDYAMSETAPQFNLACLCASEHCRKIITGEDWSNLTLQAKYRRYFSEYILKKIESRNLIT